MALVLGMTGNVSEFVLEQLVRTLEPRMAYWFLGHLSDELQEKLWEVEPASRSDTSLSGLLDAIITKFSLPEATAQTALVHIGMEIAAVLRPAECNRLKSALPTELAPLLTPPGEPSRHAA